MKALRIAAVVLGLALAVYGTASLTGGWLGPPPWWDHYLIINGAPKHVFEPARGWMGVTVLVAGLALATVAAWPRHPKRAPPA